MMSADYSEYSTHQQALAKALYLSKDNKKPVVEFGCGSYSTPILHSLCADKFLLSLDSRKEWLDRFKHYANDNHKLLWMSNWDKFYNVKSSPISVVLYGDYCWGVVFIDHDP